MAEFSIASLLVRQSKAVIYTTGIRIARAIGLPVDTWQPGDPSRTQFWAQAELLEAWEDIAIGFISAGFPELAAKIGGIWIEVCAKQFFNIDVPDATFASTDIVLTNSGGGFYDNIEPQSLTFKNPETGKTYRNTTGGTLASGSPGSPTTLTLTIEAEEAGSASTAGAGEISEFVDGYLDVTVSNPTGAVGLDKQSPAATLQQCLDKIDRRSPNGPRGIYRSIALDQKITGTTAVTRARSWTNTDDKGGVSLYLAGPSGGVPEADRALVETAIIKNAVPLCITPFVYSANNVEVATTYEAWVYASINRTEDELKGDIAASIAKELEEREIGGDVPQEGADGIIAKSVIEQAISGTHSKIFKVVLASPSVDVVLGRGDVAVSPTPVGTIHFVVDP